MNGQFTKLLSPPAEPAISIAQCREHSRIPSFDVNDTVVSAMRDAAVEIVEQQMAGHISLVDRTYEQWQRTFVPVNTLDHYPLKSITKVEYYDADDVLTEVDSSIYEVYAPRHIRGHAFSEAWPLSTAARNYPVVVTYVSGFGGAEDVPAGLVNAALMVFEDLHRHRGSTQEGKTSVETGISLDRIVRGYFSGMYP